MINCINISIKHVTIHITGIKTISSLMSGFTAKGSMSEEVFSFQSSMHLGSVNKWLWSKLWLFPA